MSNIDLKNKELSQYDTNEIKEFLKEIGLNSYIQNFEKYQIDGYDLCNLSDDLLKLLEFSNIHDINKLKRHIHLKLLHQLKLNLSYQNKIYPFQLDYLPELTIENLQNIISKAFDIKEVLLSTLDNQILTPQIRFIELLLVEYEKYKNLKIFNPNESQSQNKKNEFSRTMEHENKYKSTFDMKIDTPKKKLENKNEEKEQYNFKINTLPNKAFSSNNSSQDLLKKNNDIIPKGNFNKEFNKDLNNELNIKKSFGNDKNYNNEFNKDFTQKEFKDFTQKEFNKDFNQKEFNKDFNQKEFNKDFNQKEFNKDFISKDFNKDFTQKEFNKDFKRDFNQKEINKDFNPKDFIPKDYSKDFNKNEYIPKDFSKEFNPKDFKRDLNIETTSYKEISNSNFKDLNHNIKTSDSFKEENQPQPQMQIPQKYSKDFKTDFPSFKPYTPSTNFSIGENNNLNLNKPQINLTNEKTDFDNMKIYQNKFSQINTNKDDLLKRNYTPDLNLNKDKKDFNTDINNQTPNYVFNSGELNKFEKYSSLNKNQNFTQNPTLDSLVKESPDLNKNPLSNNLNINIKDDDTFLNRKFGNYNLQNNVSEPSNIKDTFKRYQSEKRTFRTYNEIQNNNDLTNTTDDFKTKQYQKYNENPLEELNDKFNSNEQQFNRFSNRLNKNNLNNEDNEINNLNFKNNSNTIPSLRGNFGLDRKPLQIDNQKEMYNFKLDK